MIGLLIRLLIITLLAVLVASLTYAGFLIMQGYAPTTGIGSWK